MGGDSQGVQVAAAIDRGPRKLLGTHEAGGTRQLALVGDRPPVIPIHVPVATVALVITVVPPVNAIGICTTGADSGDSEVGEERPAGAPLQEDVVGLHIQVHDPGLGGGVQGLGHLPEHLPHRRGAQGTGPAHPLAQALAVDVRHHQED